MGIKKVLETLKDSDDSYAIPLEKDAHRRTNSSAPQIRGPGLTPPVSHHTSQKAGLIVPSYKCSQCAPLFPLCPLFESNYHPTVQITLWAILGCLQFSTFIVSSDSCWGKEGLSLSSLVHYLATTY